MKNDLDHARLLLEKATNDLKAAEIGFEHGAPTDTVAFHLQQAAEKLIKALLTSKGILYPKTHDLKTLFASLPVLFQSVHDFRDSVVGWTSYAVDMRYETSGYPDREEIQQSLRIAQDLYTAVSVLLASPANPETAGG